MTGEKQSKLHGKRIPRKAVVSSLESQERGGHISTRKRRSKSRATRLKKEHEHRLFPASVYLNDFNRDAWLHLVCDDCGGDFVIQGAMPR